MTSLDVNALLRQRYGADAPELTDPALISSETLALLLRHRSVRSFADDEVSEEVVTAIVAAAQSAASSSNNQSWSVVEVRDRDRLRRLVTHARGSELIADAPVVLMFVADWARASEIARWHDEPAEAAAYLESTLVGRPIERYGSDIGTQARATLRLFASAFARPRASDRHQAGE